MRTLSRIAVVLNYEGAWGRGVLKGIFRYAVPRRDWAVLRRPNHGAAWADVREWRPDGIIAEMHTTPTTEAAVAIGVPLVSLSAPVVGYDVPRVGFDDRAVGALAARHLSERGLRTLAYAGTAVWPPSRVRESGFSMAAQNLGCRLAGGFDFGMAGPNRLPVDLQLRAWVRGMPRPVGVFCFNDEAATRVAEACFSEELRVPDDVAVLGVDNDELLCDITYPPLSSIQMPLERLGHEAARLLDELLAGAQVARPVVLPPTGAVTRASTDVLAVDDSEVAAALRFIRANVERPLTVDDLVAEVPLGRRTLERRFQMALGYGPRDAIRRARIDYAKALLANSDESVDAVARALQVPDASSFCHMFRRATGLSPLAYRKQCRLGRD